MKENLIQTEVSGLYRDMDTKALVVKSDPIHKELIKKIKELERRIRVLEEKLNNK